MAWIAFASVPTILVLMLAMGQLEARLLPRTPPRRGAGDPFRAVRAGHRTWVIRYVQPDRVPRPAAEPRPGAGPRWEIRATPPDGRKEAKT